MIHLTHHYHHLNSPIYLNEEHLPIKYPLRIMAVPSEWHSLDNLLYRLGVDMMRIMLVEIHMGKKRYIHLDLPLLSSLSEAILDKVEDTRESLLVWDVECKAICILPCDLKAESWFLGSISLLVPRIP